MIDENKLEEDSSSDIFVVSEKVGRSTSSPRQRHVLAIEDSEVDFACIRHYLHHQAHVELKLTHAHTLKGGMQCLAEEHVDVVLLDLNLPDCSGLGTLRAVKSHASHVPIVVLTSEDDEGVAIEAVREGAEDFLIKGKFERNLLIRSLRYAIARHRSKLKLQRALEATRTSEENLRNIIANNVDGIVVVNHRGIIQFSNRAAQTLFGRASKELLQSTFAYSLADCEIREIEIVQSDGQRVPVEMRTVKITWHGEPSSLIMLRDLTGQKQAQAQRAHLTAIVQSSENAIVSSDLTGHLLTWNPGAAAIFNYTEEEVVGQHLSSLWPQDQREAAQPLVEQMKGGEKIRHLETQLQQKDGTRIEAVLSMFPVSSREGDVDAIGLIVADVTEQKRTQKELENKRFELQMAQAIQTRLLPQFPPVLPGFDVAGGLFPADFAAGDYYDFLPLGNGAMGFVVGDVSSHGLGPAMLMATTRAHLRSFARTDYDLAGILARLNQVLIEETKEEDFVTLLFAQLNSETRSFTYASAGHSVGYVIDASGEVKHELSSTGLPLAVLPETSFSIGGPIQLAPGDLVVFPTDGLHEARSPEGRMLGKESMLEVFRGHRDRSAAEIIEAIRAAVHGFSGVGKLTDDVTAVVLKVTGI